MNPLPSMIALDFCEWLKRRLTQQHGDNHTDMLDYFFNEEYRGVLRRLAKEYLDDGYIVRRLLHNFIDSEEFINCCNKHCHPLCLEELNHIHRHSKALRHWLHHCCCCPELDMAFDRFLHHHYGENSNGILYRERITPELLVDNVHKYFNNQKQDHRVMELMMASSSDLSLEIDFLEWLMLSYGKKSDLKKMPLSVFENLADDYCKYANRQPNDKKKLVKSFRQGDTVSFGKKLLAVLTHTQADRMKSLGYIYDRYSNVKIPFRCFFLPLASNSEGFKNFINENWLDLHEMSSDYLDIFYSEEDFGNSGYTIKKNMRTLSKDLPEKLPCLVIWQDSLQHAQAIDIEGLLDSELVSLIAKIVDLIKTDNSLNQIVVEARKMANDFNQKHVDDNRPVTNNVFKIEQNTGVVAGYIANSEITVYSGAISDIEFENETEKAIEMIQSFSEVEKEYRDVLISLVKEANVAMQNENEVAKSECKSKFKGFMLGAGKVVGEIVTKLSELATIASFFGLATTIIQ